MNHNEQTVRDAIQALGEESFPDDQVEWSVVNLICKNEYAFTQVNPTPNTVGYEKYIFVLKAEGTDNYTLTSCFVWDNGTWGLLFTDPKEDNDWSELLDSI